MASEFVEKMGGELKVKSTLGKGSSFYFGLSHELPGFLRPPERLDPSEVCDLAFAVVSNSGDQVFYPPSVQQTLKMCRKLRIEYRSFTIDQVWFCSPFFLSRLPVSDGSCDCQSD